MQLPGSNLKLQGIRPPKAKLADPLATAHKNKMPNAVGLSERSSHPMGSIDFQHPAANPDKPHHDLYNYPGLRGLMRKSIAG